MMGRGSIPLAASRRLNMNNCLNCGKEVKCKFCNSSCAAKYNNAKRPPRSDSSRKKTSDSMKGKIHSEKTKLKISAALTGRKITWCVKHTPEGIERIRNANKNRIVTQETKAKLSAIAKNRGFGGHTSKLKVYFKKNCGDIVYLQSSYELRLATILEELSVCWSRPSPFIWIDAAGKDHKYYPDFKIGELYLDTKNNYLAIKDLPKIEAVKSLHNIDLRIITEDMLTKEFIASLI